MSVHKVSLYADAITVSVLDSQIPDRHPERSRGAIILYHSMLSLDSARDDDQETTSKTSKKDFLDRL